MSASHKEREPQPGLAASDDIHAHQERLSKNMDKATELIAEYEKGGDAREALLKRLTGTEELPILIQSLTQLRDSQLEQNGLIMGMDLADGSYDNATIDRKINSQISWLSNLNISLNRMFGTRTARKVMGFFMRTMPNWMGVEWNAFKDNAKHVLIAAGTIGAAGAALTVGGYVLVYGGLTPSITALGTHLTPALTAVQASLAAAGGTAAAGWNWLMGSRTEK